jgi:dGTPase
MTETIREARERREAAIVDHPLGMRSRGTRGRRVSEPEDPIRSCYERDAHRILHCSAFRRLRYKTQVIFSPENDHVSTRVDHCLFMASIVETVARSLGLNADLGYAIALGHDLGHGPFGHAGESVLDRLAKTRGQGSVFFEHELHSLRVVDELASRPSTGTRGLNLTYEVRDGIVCHCGERDEQYLSPRAGDVPPLEAIRSRGLVPITLEGCIVRMADRVAYIGRDIEDARSVFGRLPALPDRVVRVLGRENSAIINTLVHDLIRTNQKTPERIGFSDAVFEALCELYQYNVREIYRHPELLKYSRKIERMLDTILEWAMDLLATTPQDRWGKVEAGAPWPARFLNEFIVKMYPQDRRPETVQIVVDWVSLMTDRFARNVFEALVLPDSL